jgi:activator of HSP90 ATPase
MEFILNHLTLKYCFLLITSNNCYMKKDSLLQHIKSCIVLSVSFVIFQINHAQTATAVNPANTIVIHQEVDFKITPSELFHALIDSKQFSDITAKAGGFSAGSAKIDNAPGGAFSVFDGHIVGRILEIVPDKRIVEAWRVSNWPEGIYSIVKFELSANGTGTHLVFDHIGFPENLKEHLASGWKEHYWDMINAYYK